MSLEQALIGLTEALTKHTETLARVAQYVDAKTSQTAGSDVPVFVPPAGDSGPKRGPGRPAATNKQPDKPAEQPAVSAPVPAAPAEAAKAAAPNAEEAAKAVYDNLKKVTNELALAKGRDAAVAVLKSFGVESAKELKPEQWADCILAMKKAKDEADELA